MTDEINNIKEAERSVSLARNNIKINPADLAVEALLYDISDRRGLKSELAKIDKDVIE